MSVPFLLTPFTAIHGAYYLAFKAYLASATSQIQAAVATPLLACVTLWAIVQGILVMRGDLDPRRGLTKMITVALVVGLVTSSTLYQTYIQDMFEVAIPTMVQRMGGGLGLPVETLPTQLDAILRGGTWAFQKVAARVPETDSLDALSFQGAQFVFYFNLWSIFIIFDTVNLLTSILIAVGPLFLLGFLFDATKGIASQWIGQLIGYAILLLLTALVAQVVVGVMIATFGLAALALLVGGPPSAQIVGLYELDMFVLTGNALIVALPAIAAQIGGGVAAQGAQIGQSVLRNFRGQKVEQQTIFNVGMMR